MSIDIFMCQCPSVEDGNAEEWTPKTIITPKTNILLEVHSFEFLNLVYL
jgi:hypothetical protein